MRPNPEPTEEGDARPQPEEQVGTSSKPVDGGESSASTNSAGGAVAELTGRITQAQEQRQQRWEKVVQDPRWKTTRHHIQRLRDQVGGSVPVCQAGHGGPCSSLGRQPSAVGEGGNVTVRLPVTNMEMQPSAETHTGQGGVQTHVLFAHKH